MADNLFNLLSALALIAFFLGCIVYAKGLRRLEKTVDRMEAATAVVATNLQETAAALQHAADQRDDLAVQVNRMEAATRKVAADLAASVERADAADSKVTGASADAALRTGDSPKRRSKKVE